MKKQPNKPVADRTAKEIAYSLIFLSNPTRGGRNISPNTRDIMRRAADLLTETNK